MRTFIVRVSRTDGGATSTRELTIEAENPQQMLLRLHEKIDHQHEKFESARELPENNVTDAAWTSETVRTWGPARTDEPHLGSGSTRPIISMTDRELASEYEYLMEKVRRETATVYDVTRLGEIMDARQRFRTLRDQLGASPEETADRDRLAEQSG